MGVTLPAKPAAMVTGRWGQGWQTLSLLPAGAGAAMVSSNG